MGPPFSGARAQAKAASARCSKTTMALFRRFFLLFCLRRVNSTSKCWAIKRENDVKCACVCMCFFGACRWHYSRKNVFTLILGDGSM